MKKKIEKMLEQELEILLSIEDDEDKYYHEGIYDGIVSVAQILNIELNDIKCFA